MRSRGRIFTCVGARISTVLLPRPPGSLIEQAERGTQRAPTLEGRLGELQAQLDEREWEILALRDSLRKTIRERNTGT